MQARNHYVVVITLTFLGTFFSPSLTLSRKWKSNDNSMLSDKKKYKALFYFTNKIENTLSREYFLTELNEVQKKGVIYQIKKD